MEVHPKSVPCKEWLPKPWGKGDGAEADAVAGISTGIMENIPNVVAFLRRAI